MIHCVYGCGGHANIPDEDKENVVFHCILNGEPCSLQSPHYKNSALGHKDAHFQLERHSACAVLGSKVHSSLSFDQLKQLYGWLLAC